MRKLIVSAFAGLLISGCVTMHQGGSAVSMKEEWALLPFVNNTDSPFAGERAEAITAALLHARGIVRLERQSSGSGKPDERLIADRGEQKQKAALEAVKLKNIRYALAGTVNEWRYKVGLDGEPVVGFTLQVIDLKEGKIVWSGAAGKSGWSRDAVSSTAQQVLDKLIGAISEKQ